MWWWWWAWVVFVIVVFLVPWSYGWGRRGWGPPYPTYYRRRGARRGVHGAAVAPEPADTDPYDPTVPPMRDRVAGRDDRIAPGRRPGDGWTWLADLFWLGALAAIAWAIYLWVT